MPAGVRARYWENIERHQAERRLQLYQVIGAAVGGGSHVPGMLVRWQQLAGWIEESARAGINRLRWLMGRYLDPNQGVVED